MTPLYSWLINYRRHITENVTREDGVGVDSDLETNPNHLVSKIVVHLGERH